MDPMRDAFTECFIAFAWTIVGSVIAWLLPIDLPVGFALAMPPVLVFVWNRHGRMPLLAVQVAQAVSGTRGVGSLAGSIAAHMGGAAAAVCVLHFCEGEFAPGLVPHARLGDGVSQLHGMVVEATVVCWIASVVALLPNWLASRGYPKPLMMLCVMPSMMLSKRLSGPSLQPHITLAVTLMKGGTSSAVDSLLPFVLGPLLGGVVFGLALRGRRLPHQKSDGVPLRLLAYSELEADETKRD